MTIIIRKHRARHSAVCHEMFFWCIKKWLCCDEGGGVLLLSRNCKFYYFKCLCNNHHFSNEMLEKIVKI